MSLQCLYCFVSSQKIIFTFVILHCKWMNTRRLSSIYEDVTTHAMLMLDNWFKFEYLPNSKFTDTNNFPLTRSRNSQHTIRGTAIRNKRGGTSTAIKNKRKTRYNNGFTLQHIIEIMRRNTFIKYITCDATVKT